MTRLRLAIVAATFVGGSFLAACGGGSATPSPTLHATLPAPTAPAAAGSSATPAAPSQGAGASQVAGASQGSQPTLAVPSFTIPSFAIPSFAADNDLAAKFPTTIDGQPVTNVQTALFIDILKFTGQTQDKIQALAQALSGFGIDLNTLSSGSADATVGGEDVKLQALRAPGADASQIVTHYSEIGVVFNQALGNAAATTPPTMSQANLGGKNVTVATDADGKKSYLYPNGDTLWIVSDMTDDQATKVLSALP